VSKFFSSIQKCIFLLKSKRQEITSVGEDMEKKEHLCTIGGNVNMCSHCGKQYGGSSNN